MTLEEWLERPAEWFSQLWQRHRVTILATVAFNLAVLVALLSLSLSATSRFIDQTLLIAIEPQLLLPEERAPGPVDHAAWGEKMAPTQVRNITVDASQPDPLNAGLNDEKQINAQELYEDAARVRGEMQANRERFEEANPFGEIEIPNTPQKTVKNPDGIYKGPSVASYNLPNRRAYSLPVPSYKCKQGGPVIVDILVDRAGRVADAQIDQAASKPDPCLWEAALIAARRSLFNASTSASPHQQGSITYMFVAQ